MKINLGQATAPLDDKWPRQFLNSSHEREAFRMLAKAFEEMNDQSEWKVRSFIKGALTYLFFLAVNADHLELFHLRIEQLFGVLREDKIRADELAVEEILEMFDESVPGKDKDDSEEDWDL